MGAKTWGMASHELDIIFPCDNWEIEYDPACTVYRGITIEASPDIVFKWISQFSIAPYSYDWIDNRGRISPRRLIPDLPPLVAGQIIWGIFELIAFEINKSLTLRAAPSGCRKFQFEDFIMSYLIYPQTDQSCRLLVKGLVKYRSNLAGRIIECLMPGLDLIMMRKQLLNIKMLAERKEKEEQG